MKTGTKKTAHTPGPWKAGRAVLRGMIAEISATRGEATYTIAHVDCVDGGDKDAANAHLIAAAPDLLEACADFLEAFDLDDLANFTGEQCDAILSARAAIAKARGES